MTNRRLSLVALFCGLAIPAAAQDLAITNARVIVGNGTIVESGTIVVRGGRIVSVSPGAANTQGLKVIDGRGMSAMAGFIDAHKHVNTGPDERAQMQALLEAGYTTILSGGGPADGTPESIVGANRVEGAAIGTEAGYTIVNARTIWDAGGLVGYCTDTGYEPRAGLEHELKSYSIVFSMPDIFKLMGP